MKVSEQTSTHDDLCKTAYRFWQERGCPDGSPEVDWQRAEEGALGRLGRPAEHHAHADGSSPRVRINLANQFELMEIPGIGPAEAEDILKVRAEHGPIRDEQELSAILGGRPVPEALVERVDFSPADATAAEAPGA